MDGITSQLCSYSFAVALRACNPEFTPEFESRHNFAETISGIIRNKEQYQEAIVAEGNTFAGIAQRCSEIIGLTPVSAVEGTIGSSISAEIIGGTIVYNTRYNQLDFDKGLKHFFKLYFQGNIPLEAQTEISDHLSSNGWITEIEQDQGYRSEFAAQFFTELVYGDPFAEKIYNSVSALRDIMGRYIDISCLRAEGEKYLQDFRGRYSGK